MFENDRRRQKRSEEVKQKISESLIKFRIDKKKLYKLYIEENYSLTKLSKYLNFSVCSIVRKLRKYNISKKKYPDKISQLLKNKKMSKEQKENLSKTKTKFKIKEDELYDLYVKRDLSINKLCKMFNISDGTVRRKLKKYNIKYKPIRRTEEYKKNLRIKMKGNNNSRGKKRPDNIIRNKINIHMGKDNHFYGKKHTEETKEKIRRAGKKRMESEEYKKMLSEKAKNNRKNPEWIKKYRNGLNLKPNKKEMLIDSILKNLFANEYRYVGDFSFIIDGKCPDFINVNGKKKIIEFFGNYWHKRSEEKERINLFKKFGYDTLIIWENELKNKYKLIRKINNFHFN